MRIPHHLSRTSAGRWSFVQRVATDLQAVLDCMPGSGERDEGAAIAHRRFRSGAALGGLVFGLDGGNCCRAHRCSGGDASRRPAHFASGQRERADVVGKPGVSYLAISPGCWVEQHLGRDGQRLAGQHAAALDG